MNYLIDTHTFLWYLEGNSNLSKKARSIISDPQNQILISIASIWEIGIKIALGKLIIDVDLEVLKREIIKNQMEILPLDFEHIKELVNLEQLHKDPFDRILICQSKAEKLSIITKDSNFFNYKNIECVW